MKFSAQVKNNKKEHQVSLKVGDKEQSLAIPPRPNGGSSVTGGELLLLALATCYCNDIYREAGKRGITIESLEVEVDADFEAEGMPGKNIVYRAKINSQASNNEIQALMQHTDTVAEIHNTLRASTPVRLQILT